MDFLYAIAPALADLLRATADYLDDGLEEAVEQPPPPAEAPANPAFHVNSRGGFEAIDR